MITNDENELLVQPSNVEELTIALEALTNNDQLREKMKSKAFKIREKLNFGTIADQYLKVIIQ